MNVAADEEARICVPVDGDHVATIGENRKMLIFPLAEVNEMTRGKGTILQRFKDGALADARVFHKKEGLSWLDAAGRSFTLEWGELRDWVGSRAQAGRLAPKGFPRSNKFGPPFR
jgi:topoisomerase-4 subunit A